MSDVLDLDSYRPVPGTVWITFPGRCITCGYEALHVAPMPEWAISPVPPDCHKCQSPNSVLTLLEMPSPFNGPDAKPWDPPSASDAVE